MPNANSTAIPNCDLRPAPNLNGMEIKQYPQDCRYARRFRKSLYKRTRRKLIKKVRLQNSHKENTKTVARNERTYTVYSSRQTAGRRYGLARTRHQENIRVYDVPSKAQNIFSSASEIFHGAAVDTGAQRSVVGRQQALAYCNEVGVPFKPSPSRTRFRFGAGRSQSLGKIPFAIPTPQSILTLWVDVVPQDIPLLIGLDVLDKYSLQVLSVYNELECVREKWRVPVIRQHGLIYWKWSNDIYTFFTRP